MSDIISNQPWAPRVLNQSGIRRLKIIDSQAVKIINGDIVPQTSAVFFEFTFPSELSCVANVQRQKSESGSGYWLQSISFNLPHMSDSMIAWAHEHMDILWIAIAEDYNGNTRLFGGSFEGLVLTFQATSGNGPRDTNPMSFNLSAEQLIPFVRLPDYEDAVLFPNVEFDYGFDDSFL